MTSQLNLSLMVCKYSTKQFPGKIEPICDTWHYKTGPCAHISSPFFAATLECVVVCTVMGLHDQVYTIISLHDHWFVRSCMIMAELYACSWGRAVLQAILNGINNYS